MDYPEELKSSQHGVETYLNAMFSSPGTFLEIGAWNGELISQTWWLETKRGWNGLCVDPFAWGFENRTCKLCQKAVSVDGLPRQFVKVTTDRRTGGDVSYFSGFMDSLKVHWPMIIEHCDYEIAEIETITFDDLMKEYQMPNHVEFLSIDAEGAELEIFKGIDFSKYSFDVIDYEHNEDPKVKYEVGRLLEAAGYRHWVSLRVDSLYVHHSKQP